LRVSGLGWTSRGAAPKLQDARARRPGQRRSDQTSSTTRRACRRHAAPPCPWQPLPGGGRAARGARLGGPGGPMDAASTGASARRRHPRGRIHSSRATASGLPPPPPPLTHTNTREAEREKRAGRAPGAALLHSTSTRCRTTTLYQHQVPHYGYQQEGGETTRPSPSLSTCCTSTSICSSDSGAVRPCAPPRTNRQPVCSRVTWRAQPGKGSSPVRHGPTAL